VLRPIYLDAHATTPCDPRVVSAMLPFFSEEYGNAASRHHAWGWAAREASERAREQVAVLVGAGMRDVVFTSGATESNNLAIKGVAEALADRGRHIVTVVTEHRAVLDPCAALESRGFRVTRLAVGCDGLIDLAELERAMTPDTILVSVMAANNEIGVVQPIAAVGALCEQHGVLFHTDASQAVGKIPIDVVRMGIHLMSWTAHKMYGPKGIGALYVRRKNPRVAIQPQIHGGGHERGLRSGTLNVPAVVGFGAASALSHDEMETEGERLASLRDRLRVGLEAGIPGLTLNGSTASRLPHNLHVSIPGVEGSHLFLALDDIAVSPGAACSTASAEPSHVLAALGIDPDLARASIRFGLTRFTTAEEIDHVVCRLTSLVPQLMMGSRSGNG
jgi:cysteine desulfurase